MQVLHFSLRCQCLNLFKINSIKHPRRQFCFPTTIQARCFQFFTHFLGVLSFWIIWALKVCFRDPVDLVARDELWKENPVGLIVEMGSRPSKRIFWSSNIGPSSEEESRSLSGDGKKSFLLMAPSLVSAREEIECTFSAFPTSTTIRGKVCCCTWITRRLTQNFFSGVISTISEVPPVAPRAVGKPSFVFF